MLIGTAYERGRAMTGTPQDLVRLYLEAARAAVDQVADPAVERSWAAPSVLPDLTVGALAAHLARSVLLVETYLDAPDPLLPQPITAEEYFARFGPPPELEHPANAGVRARSVEGAAAGPAVLAEQVRACLERLATRLPATPDARQVSAFGGSSLIVGEFLRTRLVEFAVHGEDLATSLGAPAPDVATAAAVDVLVGTARVRHGDAAVLRALARRERDAVGALRVL